MEPKNTRDQILEAALALFSEKGFSGTTTREIAQQAGCAEGTIFRYFPTKKDILISLVRPHALEELQRVMGNLSHQGEVADLRLILENRVNTIRKNKKLIKVIVTEAQFHEELREYLLKNIGNHVLGTLSAYMTKRMEEGKFREADPQVLSRILAGMMISFVLTENFYPMDEFGDKKKQDYLDEIINVFLYGVVKKGE